jgi:xanthine dehydrogenase YagS FAD-binding subunit
MHAILGASDGCIATHPSDMAVAMAALYADIELLGADNAARRVPIGEFYSADSPDVETVLRPSEMITAVAFPAAPPGRQVYRKSRSSRSPRSLIRIERRSRPLVSPSAASRTSRGARPKPRQR